MKKHLKFIIKNIFKQFGIGLYELNVNISTPKTDKNTLLSLIHKLWPISTDSKLIRLGPDGDGGYLVPDDLAGIEACFSPGVSEISGFEKDCAELGMKVFLADKSVNQPAESHGLFNFTQKFVGVTTSDDFMTVDDWVNSSLTSSQTDLILQIDIEGCEYETFLAMSDVLMLRYRIIVAEFHFLDQLWSQPFFMMASRAFEKILQTHSCVHIHPNNGGGTLDREGISIPREAEVTFLRNDRVRNPSYTNLFPHPLDRDNTINPHISLPSCWHYRG